MTDTKLTNLIVDFSSDLKSLIKKLEMIENKIDNFSNTQYNFDKTEIDTTSD